MARITDSAISSGQVFLVSQLEKQDPRLLRPLTSVTWPRDIVAKTGGGWVEFTSNYFVNYATSGANQYGFSANDNTSVPIIQANITKDVFPVYTWKNALAIPYVDQQKLQQVGQSLDQILDDGLRLNWNKTLDANVYTGFTQLGTYGLVNNPNVAEAAVPKNAGNTSRAWVNKTPGEILSDVDNAIETGWANANYDDDAIPNQILIPPSQYAFINRQIVSSAGNISTLTYLQENNIAKARGFDFKIFPCRQCIGVGSAVNTTGVATDRMVAYVNKENFVCYDIPVPIQRTMTQPSVEQGGVYLTLYVAQIGVVKFKYFQPVTYWDGI